MKKLVFPIFFVYFLTQAYAKVDPPNYDFSLKKFDLFMPGSKLADIEKEYKFKEVVFNQGTYITYKFYVEHMRYKFAILVQTQDGIVLDFHARLPQYFLHDIFHQSLINKIGKQNTYKNKNEHSLYVWDNTNGNQHIYSSACTITCFPIYYAVKKIMKNQTGEYKSILEKLESGKI